MASKSFRALYVHGLLSFLTLALRAETPVSSSEHQQTNYEPNRTIENMEPIMLLNIFVCFPCFLENVT